MKPERSDKLRRRPKVVRYFYLAVSNVTLHTGISYGGLTYILKNHILKEIYMSDLVTGTVFKVNEPIKSFMDRWRMHYNDPDWDYSKEIETGVAPPVYD